MFGWTSLAYRNLFLGISLAYPQLGLFDVIFNEIKIMLDDKDIQKFIEVFPTKEEVVSKEDFKDFREEMRKSFSDLQALVDAYAKKADVYFQEMVALFYK
ncbi:MAG: hypothetical protein KJI70_02190 [Patescibacteria group bacterium]|nr:hypothetical protein [Patescibacteria group bacterium]